MARKSKDTSHQEADAPQISKNEAARRAIAAGMEKPAEAVEYIRREFGIDMAPRHFSAARSQMRRNQRNAGKPSRKPEANGANPPRGKPADGDADLLRAMETMKPLVESLGKDKVRRIVDLLG